jgi:penicillin-binding protein 2
MHDVTEVGTAALIPKIPGIEICAKTGTAQNKRVIDKKVVELKDHSLFVCFAPKENPKIAVSVIIENGGFGATWAGPIGYLLVEKYLTDSLRADRQKEVERIAAANLMPSYLTREQFIADSIRAYQWFQMTNDSSYIDKYTYEQIDQSLLPDKETPPPAERRKSTASSFAIIDDKNFRKKSSFAFHS